MFIQIKLSLICNKKKKSTQDMQRVNSRGFVRSQFH